MKLVDLYQVGVKAVLELPDEDDAYKVVEEDKITSFNVVVVSGAGIAVAAKAAEKAGRLWREKYDAEEAKVKSFSIISMDIGGTTFSE